MEWTSYSNYPLCILPLDLREYKIHLHIGQEKLNSKWLFYMYICGNTNLKIEKKNSRFCCFVCLSNISYRRMYSSPRKSCSFVMNCFYSHATSVPCPKQSWICPDICNKGSVLQNEKKKHSSCASRIGSHRERRIITKL